MATTIADLSELLKDVPAGAWVAVSEAAHKVVAFGPDAQAVMEESHRQGEPHPLIVRVPEQTTAVFL